MRSNKSHIDIENWLDEALKTDPGFSLPNGFADRMAEQVNRRFAWLQYFKEFAIYLGAILGILSILVVVQVFLIGADWQQWLTFISKNISLVIGANILLVFILFADKVLLQYFMFKSSGKAFNI